MQKQKKKSLLCKLFFCLAIFALLFGLVWQENRPLLEKVGPQLYIKIGDEVIQPWFSDETYYVFLPSYADLDRISLTPFSEEIRYENPSTEGNELIRITRKGSFAGVPMNQALSCVRPKDGSTYQLCFMQSANLPTMFVQTSSGNLDKLRADKNYFERGSMTLYDTEGQQIGASGLTKFAGRGNTSFNSYEKKPWNIKLEKKQNLLDLGSGNEYALISNGSDPTLVRNDYMRSLEEALGVAYVQKGRFIDLYVNGEFQGNYYLCTPMAIGDNRIDVTSLEQKMSKYLDSAYIKNAEVYEASGRRALKLDGLEELSKLDVTGGYLLEREYKERYLVEYYDTPSSFVTEQDECFMVKSPKYCSGEQIEYIGGYVDDVESAILSKDGIHPDNGKKYSEYIDVESFARRVLAEEISKNYDAGVSSTFFYKDREENGGLLKMAPGWDYDMSLGNYKDWMEEISGDPYVISKLSLNAGSCSWFSALYDKEDFLQLLIQIYEEKGKDFLQNSPKLMEEYKETLMPSIEMNHCRWQKDLKEYASYENPDKAFDALAEFIRERMLFLDSEWLTSDGI